MTISLTVFCHSQNYKISRGEEIKMSESSNSLGIIHRDRSGVYVVQTRAKANRLSLKDTYSTIYSLYKLDKNFSLVFNKDYKNALKGYDLNSFQVLNDELFLFATDYNK